MRFKYLLLQSFAISTIIYSSSFAAQTSCPDHFVNGQAPDLINEKLAVKNRELCYSGFAVKHSGVTRAPLYAAEHLTRERLLQANGLKKKQ